ncbi:MAG: hypothetical protein ACLFPJ_04855 [Candidatus Woesearchaeota archaeon]
MLEALLSPEAWGSPLGVGIFLMCLGVFIYLLSLADKNKKTKK